MPLSEKTAGYISALCSACTGGERGGASIPAAREALYGSLVRSVHDDTLGRAFPITLALLPPDEWDRSVSRFLREGSGASPALWRMPGAFVEWALRSDLAGTLGRPYLADLLRFEWVEIEVFMMEDLPIPEHSPEVDPASGRLVLNPHRAVLDLSYPVFKMPAVRAAGEPGLYHLVCYRDPRSLAAAFLEVSALGKRVLEIAEAREVTGMQAIVLASRELGLDAPDAAQARAFFSDLARARVVLGVGR